MAWQSLLSRLPRKGLLGSSSNGIGKVHICDDGIWTSRRKLPLLLPGRMLHLMDIKNLHSFAPMNYSLQPGNHSRRYQCDGTHDLLLQTGKFVNLALQGADLLRADIQAVADHVRGCLVFLAFSQGGKILAELPGTIIRSDGIIATSARCLNYLKSKELKVDVRIMYTAWTCNGVLLDADFCCNITLVKIEPHERQPAPKIGMFCCLRHMNYAVAAGRSFPHSGGVLAEPRYVPCYKRFPTSETEKTMSLNAWPSGQTINAVVRNGQAADIGACLVDPMRGVVGIIHDMHGSEVKATPIGDVFKTLEDIEMHRATPESDSHGVEV